MINSLGGTALFFIILGGLLIAGEVGFRIGRRQRLAGDKGAEALSASLQGTLLGLLALLLGFTFAMAVSRFDARKDLVLQEANSIGTAYMRAQLLPDSKQNELRSLIRTYVDARLTFYDKEDEPDFLQKADHNAEQLQTRIWNVAVSAAEEQESSEPRTLIIQSINEFVDLYEKRIRAMENHVPETVLELLVLVAMVAMGFVGQGCGLVGPRRFISGFVISLLITLAILVVVDLDRPRRGLITVGEESMMKLKTTINRSPE